MTGTSLSPSNTQLIRGSLVNVSVSVDNSSGYLLSSSVISGGNVYAGSIAGYAIDTVIYNCSTSGSVQSTASSEAQASTYAGGFVGYAENVDISYSSNQCTVYSCSENPLLAAVHSCAGGLAGYLNGGVIERVYNSGNVSVDPGNDCEGYSGGLVGNASAVEIADCFNEGSISASTGLTTNWMGGGSHAYAGGIAGAFDGTVTRVYNAGAVSAKVNEPSYMSSGGKAYAGGICGMSASQAEISCAAAVGTTLSTTSATAKYQYSISYGGVQSNTVGVSEVTSGTTSASITKTQDEMKSSTVYQNTLGWDFSTVWEMVEGKDFPQLKQEVPIQAAADKYLIIVQDGNGGAVSGAAVTYSTQSGTTDENGRVTFDRYTVGEPTITVTREGYHSYSNANINYSKSELGYEIIKLYAEDESVYMLTSAVYQNTTNGVPTGAKTNLLVNTKRLSLSHTVADEFQIECAAIDTSSVSDYQLWQGETKIAESTTGSFSGLEIGNFSKGGNVFIRVCGQDETEVETEINLLFVDDKAKRLSSQAFQQSM